MSNHGLHETGEKVMEKRVESTQHILAQNTLLTGHTTRIAGILAQPGVQHSEILKTAMPAGARPIAPAPGLAVNAKLIGPQGQHLVPKGLGAAVESISLQPGGPAATQTVAVNLSTQTVQSNVAGSPALHITMSSQSLHSLTLPTTMTGLAQAGAIVQGQQYAQVRPQVSSSTEELLAKARQDKDKSRVTVLSPGGVADQDRARATIPMASLIRGTLPQALQHTPAQVNLTLTQNPGVGQGHGTPSQTPIIHALPPSHIPRGPAAASALAAQKIGTVANPILRPSQALSANTQLQSPLLPTRTQGVQARAPLRPVLPQSQVVTTSVSAHHQADIQRASAHIMTSLPGSASVQISGVQGRPTLSHVQATKGTIAATQPMVQQAYTPQPAKGTITATQPMVQQTFSPQTQKVVVAQSQMLAPGTPGATLVSVATPKLHQGQNLALNLAQAAGGATRTQKIITTQVQSLATNQGSLAASLGGQALSQQIPRGQKVVVSQSGIPQSIPAGAVVVNTAAKQGVAGINLGQVSQRPQKVIMSQVAATTVMSNTVPVTMATMPKPISHGNIGTQAMIAPTTVSTTTVTTVPISKKVKVQAQRPAQQHVNMTTSQHLAQDPSTAHVPVPGQIRPVTSQSTGHITHPHVHPAGQIQGNLFGIPGTRPVAATPVGVASVATTGPVTTPGDPRAPGPDRTVRPGFQPHIPFPIPDYNNIGAANYYPYNLVYQTAFTPGSTMRPSIAVPGQPANIAATLQAAPQGTLATATGIQTGVRLNPPSVMVNVNPPHANTITMATQFAGTNPPEIAHVTAVAAPITPGPPINHPGGGATAMSHGTVSANQQQGSTISQPMNASPRPSILRKRTHDPGSVMIVKKNLLSSVTAVESAHGDLASHLPAASPKPSSIDPCRENSQSSTDTASSAESTPQSNSDIKVKTEPLDAGECDATTGLMMFGQITNNNIEASPRKKPRKQRLEANHEMQDDCSSDEELDKLAKEDIKKELEWMEEDLRKEEAAKAALAMSVSELVDEEGVRWTRDRRRPPINLMNHYACNWKARTNHFVRYNDVKSKDERRPTVNELANQKGIHQKASGWKMYHLGAQLEELMDLERDVFSSMSLVQDCIAPKHIAKNPTMEDDISMVHELTQGNIQRCQLVMDQLEEARVSMVKVLDHKKRISDIINKHHSKRPVKKKERT